MRGTFENFDILMDDSDENNRTLLVACKDRNFTDEERWVLTALSETEARRVYEYLHQYFN